MPKKAKLFLQVGRTNQESLTFTSLKIYTYKNSSALHPMLDANNFGDYILVSCNVCDVF
jgi:hypothetical protein